MDTNGDGVKTLLDRLKTISFMERVFGWRKIKVLLFDAIGDWQKLLSNSKNLQDSNTGFDKRNEVLHQELRSANENLSKKTEELAMLKQKMENLEQQYNKTKEQNSSLLNNEEHRKEEHRRALATLERIQNDIKNERDKETDEKNKAEIDRIKRLKETWSDHEVLVKNTIKAICNKHTIEYVEQVPFKGSPDNTLKICDEYVIFDAKSPAGEELVKFGKYIKEQAEAVKKYAKQDDVKRDIFLVVPSNTLAVLDNFVYHLADYTVFVISIDALEPVILSLQKIEEYEFAEQLSPEERENICRVLGKFAHLSKRRIQVDSFFAKQFIELAYKCENDLPKDIYDKAVAFERSEKLNPPMEKRAKQINTKELEHDAMKVNSDANAKGIVIQDLSAELNGLPLYIEPRKE